MTDQSGESRYTERELEPDPAYTATVRGLRLSSLQTISTRLGRVTRFALSRLWFAAAALCFGGALGGWIAMPPFAEDNPGKVAIASYQRNLWLVALAGVLCLVAGFTTQKERADSVRSIKSDLDELLEAYKGALAKAHRGDNPKESLAHLNEILDELIQDLEAEGKGDGGKQG